jgi:hypothetical protein
MEGGFFLRKKPLSIPVSVKSRSENAVASIRMASWTMGCLCPYSVDKILVFLSLQTRLRCKIPTTMKFPAKYFREGGYAQFKEALNKFPGNASIPSGVEARTLQRNNVWTEDF